MIRIAAAILIASMLSPAGAYAAQDTSDMPQLPEPSPEPQDLGLNRQILETLKDIRDSQLSVLQAQVEILSILRAQGKPALTAHGRTGEPAPGHRPAPAKAVANAAPAVFKTSRSAAR